MKWSSARIGAGSAPITVTWSRRLSELPPIGASIGVASIGDVHRAAERAEQQAVAQRGAVGHPAERDAFVLCRGRGAEPALLADYSFNSKVDQAHVDDMAAIVGFLNATNRIPGQPLDALIYTYTAPLMAARPSR